MKSPEEIVNDIRRLVETLRETPVRPAKFCVPQGAWRYPVRARTRAKKQKWLSTMRRLLPHIFGPCDVSMRALKKYCTGRPLPLKEDLP